jgi:hypothetical protein
MIDKRSKHQKEKSIKTNKQRSQKIVDKEACIKTKNTSKIGK